jgi:hypothetical protein
MVFALGRIGLAEGEFARMTLRQFLLRADAFNEQRDDRLEETRMVVATLINIHAKKKVNYPDVIRLKRDRVAAIARTKQMEEEMNSEHIRKIRERIKREKEAKNGR